MAVVNLSLMFPEPGKPGLKRGPLPKQKLFLDTVLDPKGPKYVGYYGGVGSGKSLVLCSTMITQAVVYGGEYVIARQYMPELRRTTYKTFKDICPRELIVQDRIADAEIHLRSASGKPAIIYFVGLDEPDKLRSLNLSGFAVDEASQTTEEAFLLLMNRLRNPLGLRKGVIVGNPAGHDWVFHRFVKKDVFPSQEAAHEYAMILAPSTENVHLPAGYVESMLINYSPERIQREVMGSFDAFEGQVYTEFRRNLHVVPPFKIPDEWPRVIGIDHGYRNPSAWVWGAVDPDGAIYIYREFYQREWLIEEIVKGKDGKPGVAALMKGEKIEGAFIDPSTRAQRNERNGEKVSDFVIYSENLPADFPLMLANNDVTVGIDRVKTYLKTDARNKARLYIFDTCTNLIEEITKYRYRELRPSQEGKNNAKEEPYKHDDHAVDALRYLIMSRPEPMQELPSALPKGVDPGSSAARIYKDIQRLKAPKSNSDPFGI